MPPFNDIYIVAEDRSEACINRFLADYVDLTADKARDDFEVFVNDEYIATGTLTSTIAYGLEMANRSFALYFRSAVRELESPMLFFTPDGKLVFGVSIEYDHDSSERVEEILAALQADFSSPVGIICVETHPGDAYELISKNS